MDALKMEIDLAERNDARKVYFVWPISRTPIIFIIANSKS
jgi:hypothetical protein